MESFILRSLMVPGIDEPSHVRSLVGAGVCTAVSVTAQSAANQHALPPWALHTAGHALQVSHKCRQCSFWVDGPETRPTSMGRVFFESSFMCMTKA